MERRGVKFLGAMPPETPPATTRRCRNRDCINRFVPVNANNFYCSPECRAAESTWSIEEILQEEGALLPDASPLETAKRAFGQKNQAVRRATALQSLREYLAFEVSTFYEENPSYRWPPLTAPEPDDGHKGEREVIIDLSDWQVGKLENGIGIDCMRNERLPRIKAATRAIVERQRAAGYAVNRARVVFGGDMIEGCFIYGGQNVTGLDRTANTHWLRKQCQVAAHMKAEVVYDVASYVEEVTADEVGGNHGRPNGKSDFSDPADNLDLMSGDWASDITRHEPRILWTIHDDWWGSLESLGHPVVFFHGDQWNGPFHKLEDLVPKWLANNVFGCRPALILTHHRHDFAILRVAGIPIVQNGTIDGGSKWYLKAYGKAAPPTQTITVMSAKRGVESVWPIDFNAT